MPRSSRVTGGLAVAISLLALVAAIGGTSYAAARIAANSVGTAQLKDAAVTSDKVKNRSLKAVDLKPGLAKKHVTKIDVSKPVGPADDPMLLPGIGPMTFHCASNQVYVLIERDQFASDMVAAGVTVSDGNPALLGGEYIVNFMLSGGHSFSASFSLGVRGTPLAVHLDLHGERTGGTCRFTGQIVR